MLPPVTEADWPFVHARPLEAWLPSLASWSASLALPDDWQRLPGGEDSAVFAAGEHVLKAGATLQDLRMAGRSGVSAEAIVGLWR